MRTRTRKANGLNDCDYYAKLSPAEKAFYKSAMADLYGGTPVPGSTKEERSASWHRNYALRMDALNQSRTVSIPPGENDISAQDFLDRDTGTACPEDAMIELLDRQEEARKILNRLSPVPISAEEATAIMEADDGARLAVKRSRKITKPRGKRP